MSNPKTLPLLPLRDIVVFPHMIVPLFVGRDKSVRALEEVMRADKQILLATQKNAGDDEPAQDAIHTTGVIASVLQLLKLPDGTVKVLVEGGSRVEITGYVDNPEYYEAVCETVVEDSDDDAELEALMAEHAVPAGRMFAARDMLKDPHFRAREALVAVETERHGLLPMQGVFPRLSRTPGGITRAAPAEVGKDGAALLAAAGYDADAIERFRARGVI